MVKLTVSQLYDLRSSINEVNGFQRADVYFANEDGSVPLGLPGTPNAWARNPHGDVYYLVVWPDCETTIHSY